MSTTILRKASDNLNATAIATDYAEGELSIREIAEKYSTTENNVTLVVNRFWKSLTNMRESRALISATTSNSSKKALGELQNTELINKPFLSLLSDNDSALLTQAEADYSWIYVHTGSIPEAIVSAKLDKGLYKEKKRESRFSYDRALILRGHYLNSKPNVASYIKEIREKRFIDSNIGKARVQSELLDQLEFMKASNDPRMKKDILRTIELLGKTVGAFVERIEISEISPADALDELIEMAKEAEVTTEVDELLVHEVIE